MQFPPPPSPVPNSRSSYGIPIPSIPISSGPKDELDIRRGIEIVRRRLWVGICVAAATTSSIWVWSLSQQPIYEGQFQLLVEPVTSENRLDQLAQIQREQSGWQAGLDYDTQIQVLRSPQVLNPIATALQSQDPQASYGVLLDRIKITRLGETKILEVRYRDSNPARVKRVLDQLSQGYLNYSLQERQSSLRQGIQFVDNQLNTLQARVNKLQAQLQNFRQRYNFVDPDNQESKLTEQSQTLANQKLEIRKQLAETEAAYASLQGGGAAPALRDSASYQRLRQQLQDVESKIAAESTRFSEDSPIIANLREKQQKLLPILRQESQQVLSTKQAEVTNQLKTLRVRDQELTRTEAQINQRINQLPAISRQYTDLQRELKVATESLNRFLATRETLQVESAQKDIPWQLISAPQQPNDPIAADQNRNRALAIVAGLLMGVAAILLVDRLDNTFHSLEHLKSRLKLPLLGGIPFDPTRPVQARALPKNPVVRSLKQLSSQLNRDGRKPADFSAQAAFLESFRSLHTNLRMLSSDQPIGSIVISSALPADGKSTIAIQLAFAAAIMGQRVLLVDADLRQPRIAEMLDLPNLHGLSTLINQDIDVDRVIYTARDQLSEHSNLPENLAVLTSGPVPPDSTKLLSSQKMQMWMKRFQATYDLVIYDTPPLLGFADSTLLVPNTNGLLLVVRLGRTDRGAVSRSLENLRVIQTTALGVVANGSKLSTSSIYSYYDHYYSRTPHLSERR